MPAPGARQPYLGNGVARYGDILLLADPLPQGHQPVLADFMLASSALALLLLLLLLRPGPGAGEDTASYDWSQAENELRDVLPAMFVGEERNLSRPAWTRQAPYDAEHTGLTLADVAGLDEVKKRLEAAFLAPMRNPELRKLYGKSLRGGLLLYGPPGCGKTFIARAVAGELGARFITVSFADLIDMFVGRSERNIHELFEVARRNAPCVVFLDEVDAIGQKRCQLRNPPSAAVEPAAARTGRRGVRQRACSCSPPPTIRGTWTARCAAPGGSTARCSCCRPTARHARGCSASTCETGRWPGSTWPSCRG